MKNRTSSDLAELYFQDLESFVENLASIPANKIWEKPDNIPNSAGVLAQHIYGNLNFYIGNRLGNNEYARDRDAEFTPGNFTKDELIENINKLKITVRDILNGLTDDQLNTPFVTPSGKNRTTRQALLLFYRHLNYHLGQLNYLKRILNS